MDQLFTEEEVGLIAMVSVSILGVKDRLVWTHERSGQYAVRSGYLVAQQIKRQSACRAEHSTATEVDKVLWKTIWGLRSKEKCNTSCGDASPTASRFSIIYKNVVSSAILFVASVEKKQKQWSTSCLNVRKLQQHGE